MSDSPIPDGVVLPLDLNSRDAAEIDPWQLLAQEQGLLLTWREAPRVDDARWGPALRGVSALGQQLGAIVGSTGQFTLLADDEVVYDSPTLVPGVVEKARVNLAKPYRFAIQARNTSPEGVLAWPAIGGPQFLCTDL